jgi:hypothetical protein
MTMKRVVHCRTYLSINFLQRSFPLLLVQIRRIQSILASTSEKFSSDDKSSISGDGLDFLDAPPLVDGDLLNNDYDMERKNACSNKRIDFAVDSQSRFRCCSLMPLLQYPLQPDRQC